MPKIKVIVDRDENLFPRHIEILKGKKTKLKIKQTPSPLGDTYTLEIEGKKNDLPSFTELYSIINARRIDRIGTIELIDLITKITEIETIDTITEITNIRDLIWSTRTVIQNPSFEQDLVGWHPISSSGWSIDTTRAFFSEKSLKFADLTAIDIVQLLPIPLATDSLTELAVRLNSGYTGVGLLGIVLYYTDGNFDINTLTVTAGDTWERKVLTTTANKYLYMVLLTHGLGHRECWLDHISMVF